MIIGLIVKLLGTFMGEEAAKTFAPLALIAGLALGAFLIRHDGYSDGRKDLKAEISEKVAEAREKEYERYLVREKTARASYETALRLVAEARSDAPQIVERIRNVPVAECLREPADPELYRLYVNSITGNRLENPGTRSAIAGAGSR